MKGRKDAVCKDCTLRVSGVRGAGKPETRGDRQTVKQRRKAYAEAGPSDDFFQFFDRGRSEADFKAAAADTADVTSEADEQAEATAEGPSESSGFRRLLGKRKTDPATDNTVEQGEDFVAIDEILGGRPRDESAGSANDRDAVSQLADIRSRDRMPTPGLSLSREVSMDEDVGPSDATQAPAPGPSAAGSEPGAGDDGGGEAYDDERLPIDRVDDEAATTDDSVQSSADSPGLAEVNDQFETNAEPDTTNGHDAFARKLSRAGVAAPTEQRSDDNPSASQHDDSNTLSSIEDHRPPADPITSSDEQGPAPVPTQRSLEDDDPFAIPADQRGLMGAADSAGADSDQQGGTTEPSSVVFEFEVSPRLQGLADELATNRSDGQGEPAENPFLRKNRAGDVVAAPDYSTDPFAKTDRTSTKPSKQEPELRRRPIVPASTDDQRSDVAIPPLQPGPAGLTGFDDLAPDSNATSSSTASSPFEDQTGDEPAWEAALFEEPAPEPPTFEATPAFDQPTPDTALLHQPTPEPPAMGEPQSHLPTDVADLVDPAPYQSEAAPTIDALDPLNPPIESIAPPPPEPPVSLHTNAEGEVEDELGWVHSEVDAGSLPPTPEAPNDDVDGEGGNQESDLTAPATPDPLHPDAPHYDMFVERFRTSDSPRVDGPDPIYSSISNPKRRRDDEQRQIDTEMRGVDEVRHEAVTEISDGHDIGGQSEHPDHEPSSPELTAPAVADFDNWSERLESESSPSTNSEWPAIVDTADDTTLDQSSDLPAQTTDPEPPPVPDPGESTGLSDLLTQESDSDDLFSAALDNQLERRPTSDAGLLIPDVSHEPTDEPDGDGTNEHYGGSSDVGDIGDIADTPDPDGSQPNDSQINDGEPNDSQINDSDPDGMTAEERADVDARGSWIPPALRGMAADAAEAGQSLPRRQRSSD